LQKILWRIQNEYPKLTGIQRAVSAVGYIAQDKQIPLSSGFFAGKSADTARLNSSLLLEALVRLDRNPNKATWFSSARSVLQKAGISDLAAAQQNEPDVPPQPNADAAPDGQDPMRL